MKGKTVLVIFFVIFTSVLFSQEKKLKVFLEKRQFFSPTSGTYIEIQLGFVGSTLAYKTKDSTTFSSVEVQHTISKGDSTYVLDHYVLNSPPIIDSFAGDFYDIQKYSLPPGKYSYSLLVGDINSDEKPLTASQSIEIVDYKNKVSFSPIVVASTIYNQTDNRTSYSKIGYDVIPKTGNYYPQEAQRLLYYVELYNSNQLEDSVYVIKESIKGYSPKFDSTKYIRYFRFPTTAIQPVAKAIDITSLPTGSYMLELDVIDRSKNTVTTIEFIFERYNEIASKTITSNKDIIVDPAFKQSIPTDSLQYYVASLIPIARSAEVKNIIDLLKLEDTTKNYKYLQSFWVHINGNNPYKEWINYKQQVQLVEKLFSTNYQAGFQTARGRVYLKYGSPNNIINRPSSPSEYPYIIWQYDKIGHYTNRRFIFFSPTNLNHDYKLLHSDMVGELHNPRWQYELNKRSAPGNNLYNPRGGATRHFGENATRYYNTY